MHLFCNVLTERERAKLYLHKTNKGVLTQFDTATSGGKKRRALIYDSHG